MGRELCLYLSYVHVLRFVSRLLNQDWIGLGTKSWEWEGMGTRKSFPHISNLQCNCSLLLIYRPRKDERLSWPGWVTYSGSGVPTSGVARNFQWGGLRDEAPKAPRSSAEGARIEAPKAPREVGCGEGVSPSPLGEGSGEGAVPPPQKNFAFLHQNHTSVMHPDTLLK